MKKMLCVLMVALLLMGTAFAEEITILGNTEDRFSIRNGIMFGMSRKEVEAIESSNDNGEYEIEEDSTWYFRNTVAGIDNGWIEYVFDNDELSRIRYNWIMYWDKTAKMHHATPFDLNDENTVKKRCVENYNTLVESLDEKYDCIGYMSSVDDDKIIDIGSLDMSVKNMVKEKSITYYDVNTNEYDLVGYREYLTHDGENYAVILIGCYDINMYGYTFADGWVHMGIEHAIRIEFCPVDKEIIENIIKDENSRVEQRKNDL